MFLGNCTTTVKAFFLFITFDLMQSYENRDLQSFLPTNLSINPRLSYYRNDGNDSIFLEIPLIQGGYWGHCKVVAKDFDLDGDKDIILGDGWNVDRRILFYENLGNVQLAEPVMMSQVPLSSYGTTFDFITHDIDHDGDLDVFFSSFRLNGNIGWFKNLEKIPFGAFGKLYFDENQNGLEDTWELGLPYRKVQTNNHAAYSYKSGEYIMALGAGDYTLEPCIINNWFLTSSPHNYTFSLSEDNPVETELDFGFYPFSFVTDLSCDITSYEPRCYDDVTIWATVENIGSTMPKVMVELILDDQINYSSSDILPDSIVDQIAYWNLDSLLYFNWETIKTTVRMPDHNSQGDTLVSLINCYVIDSLGVSSLMCSDTLSQILLCSYDPNDKKVTPKGEGIDGLIKKDQELTYTVRFQNTGNTYAANIKIIDTISAKLDISTFKLIIASYDVGVSVKSNNEIIFHFDNINLPDSNLNELESHGFIKYAVAPIAGLIPYQQIHNRAYIFFDNNPPIATNITINTINCPYIPQPVIYYEWPYLYSGVSCDCIYHWYLNDTLLINSNSDKFHPSINGQYSVQITDTNNCSVTSEKFIFSSSSCEEFEEIQTLVFPNPFNISVTFFFNRNLNGDYNLFIYDNLGKIALEVDNIVGHKLQVEKKSLGSGLFLAYLVEDCSKKKIFLGKLIVQ
jgi:uncharacterized repeat protein (TIGR01451 family)